MIHILIVDDHPSIIEGTRTILQQEQDLQVTVETSGYNVLDRLKNETFDLMIFDLHMPEMNGIDLSKEVLRIHPEAIIMIYTGHEIAHHFNVLVETGVSGFIDKTATKEELIYAVRYALKGISVIPTALFKELRRSEGIIVQEKKGVADEVKLNQKELDVINQLCKGKSNKEIAETIMMSQRSVEYILTGIFQKLKVGSRLEAVAKAKDFGLWFEKP